MNIKIMQRKTLAEEVAKLIANEIRHGRYRGKDKLPNEGELMSEFGVGRSTVREATKLLNHAGLLKSRQGLGTFIEARGVFYLSTDLKMVGNDFSEAHELRAILEGKLVEKAAVSRTEEDIANMRRMLDERLYAIQHNNTGMYIDADLKLHNVIAEASRNNVLLELYRSLTFYLSPFYLIIEKNQAIFRTTHHYHELLVDSIERRDPEEGKRYIEEVMSFFS